MSRGVRKVTRGAHYRLSVGLDTDMNFPKVFGNTPVSLVQWTCAFSHALSYGKGQGHFLVIVAKKMTSRYLEGQVAMSLLHRENS